MIFHKYIFKFLNIYFEWKINVLQEELEPASEINMHFGYMENLFCDWERDKHQNAGAHRT